MDILARDDDDAPPPQPPAPAPGRLRLPVHPPSPAEDRKAYVAYEMQRAKHPELGRGTPIPRAIQELHTHLGSCGLSRVCPYPRCGEMKHAVSHFDACVADDCTRCVPTRFELLCDDGTLDAHARSEFLTLYSGYVTTKQTVRILTSQLERLDADAPWRDEIVSGLEKAKSNKQEIGRFLSRKCAEIMDKVDVVYRPFHSRPPPAPAAPRAATPVQTRLAVVTTPPQLPRPAPVAPPAPRASARVARAPPARARRPTPPPPKKRGRPATTEQSTCVVCLVNEKDHALPDCGHVLCGECVQRVESCPVCRKRMTRAAIPIFY